MEVGVDWYPLWAGALYTGMRNGEIYILTWDKVNMEIRLITVSSSWSMKDGFKCTKSGHSRMVEIAAPFMELLRERKLKAGCSEYVFPRLDRWDSGDQARELRMFLLGIGLSPIRFHDLRATWATILLSMGIEPIWVIKAGGWWDMKTMMYYVRLAGVDIRGMSEVLDLHDPHGTTGEVVPLKRGNGGN